MNKLLLVGTQLPEKLRRISTFRGKALRTSYNSDVGNENLLINVRVSQCRISEQLTAVNIYTLTLYFDTFFNA
jgi:hypothetical protein